VVAICEAKISQAAADTSAEGTTDARSADDPLPVCEAVNKNFVFALLPVVEIANKNYISAYPKIISRKARPTLCFSKNSSAGFVRFSALSKSGSRNRSSP